MFGAFGAARAMQQYQRWKFATLPKRDVTKEEFIRLAKAAGVTTDKVMLAVVAMGAYAQVGDEMLRVVESK